MYCGIAPINTVLKASCPVRLVHGRQDSVVPISDAHQIWHQGSQPNGALIECEGSHDGFGEVDRIIHSIVQFVQSATRKDQPLRALGSLASIHSIAMY